MVPREIWEYYNYEQSGNLPTPELKPSSALTRDMITDWIFPRSDIKRFSSVILYRSNLKDILLPQKENLDYPPEVAAFSALLGALLAISNYYHIYPPATTTAF